jgi:hypothetical protein
MLLACAPTQPDLKPMTPQQLSLVDDTCTQVMGLKQGQYYFALCHETLAQALASRAADLDMAAAYKECRGRGLAEGSPELSTCMLASQATGPALQPIKIAYTGAPGTEPGKSFYSVPPHVQFQRERYSCAQLGLLPGSGAFGQCVANLEGAMMPPTD